MQTNYDILIIGGGINGVAIARDAAGRGYKVLLVEKSDLASATSSASTKLVHGGLRYLEHYDFRLVRESLEEREVVWNLAPHLVKPLRFVLPHHKGLRPTWLLRLGLFIYDHIGKRKHLATSRYRSLTRDTGPLKDRFTAAFEYSDCWVDDARLVVETAQDAALRGADIRTRHEVLSAGREGDQWKIQMTDPRSNELTVFAKIVVNASGPWALDVRQKCFGASQGDQQIRLVKGSHIIVPAIHTESDCHVFQQGDGRIVFSIPYEGKFTLIGTTEVEWNDPDRLPSASDVEIEYLCETANTYFQHQIEPSDVVWSYSGVRPLFDDGSANASQTTRDYKLVLDSNEGSAPLLNIFGGKLTTHRRLAQEVIKTLRPFLSDPGENWTRETPLASGGFLAGIPLERRFSVFQARATQQYPLLPAGLVQRLAKCYGEKMFHILSNIETVDDLGKYFGANLYEAEVKYLIQHEWAAAPEDILWRRTKRGLHMNQGQREQFTIWFKENAGV